MPDFVLPATPTPRQLQRGNERPEETDDARDNWSSAGSAQRGNTKHHQVPWATLKPIFNRALLDLQEKKNDALWKKIIGCSYPKGHPGANKTPLENAAEYLKKGIAAAINTHGAAVGGNEEVPLTILPQAHRDATQDLARQFCWMPGNIFLGPTPEARLDDPGSDGYDAPPRQQGGKLSTTLESVYTAVNAGTVDWSQVGALLDALKKEGVANRGKAINYNPEDWNLQTDPATNRTTYRKKK